MAKETGYNFLIGLSIMTVVVVIVLTLITQSTEPFTELYFNDHTELPSTVSLGEEYEFSFVIANHEGEIVEYDYLIFLEYSSGEEVLIESSSIILNDGESAIIDESFDITTSFGSARVVVALEDQEIYFWLMEEEE